MSTDYNYDEQGQFFPYFILTILGLVLGPLTYSTFSPSKQPGTSKARLIQDANYKPPQFDSVEAARRKQAKRERRLKRFVSLVLGWIGFGYMCYLVYTAKTFEKKIWDPYEILGISTSLTERQIKSAYRKLSLKYHPDKIRPSGNETIEMLNERFVELTKAYKALTDEDIRRNYIEYGHPDGKQSFSIGIALPKWIVAEGNTYYVLAVYGVLFGILLPYTVGKWWYGTRRRTKDGVNVESAGRLFKEYDDDVNVSSLVRILSIGEEMQDIVTADREKEWSNSQEAIVEKKIVSAGLPEKEIKALEKLEGWRRRTLGLLWAYIYRVDLGNDKLEKAKLETAPAAIALNRSFHSICFVFGNLDPLLASMRVSQHIIQAVAPGRSPLLQIPYFNESIVDNVERDGGKNHWNVQRLMALPEEKRKKLCVGKGLLTEEQYKTAMTFARNLPALKVEAAFFKVTGEKFITPSSLVNFVLKLRIVPPGSKPPQVDPKDLTDEDPDETDVNALLGRKENAEEKATKAGEDLPLAHSSYYPRDHHPTWYMFLGNVQQGKLVVPPQPITSFDKSTDSFAVVTAKMQFQAPPNPGEYLFTMMCVSDSYLGVDLAQTVSLVVSDPSKVERIEEVDDISDPEEDSLAGAMTVMKGGKTKKKEESSDDSEDSDTEGDVSDTSETNTETEDES